MKEQNFKNHSRLVKGYHGLGFFLLVAILIGSLINVCHSAPENLYSATLILAMCILVAVVMYFTRSFALKANDRAIRAQENFRHYVLTGKTLPTGLRSGQIVALRFASDDEFPALAAKAAAENLGGTAIKESITNWKPDYERV